MTFHSAITIRPAEPSDARLLAKLIDIAGEGIPTWLWSITAEAGQTALDVGERRARRETGGFSYRNALVAARGKDAVGMVLGYRIEAPDDADRAAIVNLPLPIRPFVELEHASVGTFYVNALAVRPGLRGQGIGSRMLRAAEDRAGELGLAAMSVQVFSQNANAVRLYERTGYRIVTRRPVLLHPCQPYYDEDVVLMLKDIEKAEGGSTPQSQSPNAPLAP